MSGHEWKPNDKVLYEKKLNIVNLDKLTFSSGPYKESEEIGGKETGMESSTRTQTSISSQMESYEFLAIESVTDEDSA